MVTTLLLLVSGIQLFQSDGGAMSGADFVDAGATSIYGSCPEVNYADGGTAPLAFAVELSMTGTLQHVESPDGGNDFYLPFPRAQRVSCKLAACEERNDELEVWRKPTLPWLIVSTAIVFAAAGILAMYEICSHVPLACGGH